MANIDDWEARMAMDTLKEAKKIKANPSMMRAVERQIQLDQNALNELKSGNDRARRIGGLANG